MSQIGFEPNGHTVVSYILFRIPVKAVLAKVALLVKLGLLLKATGVFAKKETMGPSAIQVSMDIRTLVLFTSSSNIP